jgi:hypothetical protein
VRYKWAMAAVAAAALEAVWLAPHAEPVCADGGGGGRFWEWIEYLMAAVRRFFDWLNGR